MQNALSIDVEDYFHVSAFERCSPPERWDSFTLRVEESTLRILDMLDAVDVKATFFVLGWVAERKPELVKEINRRGHEIASHGYAHRRVYTQSRQDFCDDIRRSKSLLEDISGRAILGYRAPSYSISRQSLWAYDELFDAGYRYDSSVFPVNHDLYGIADWPRFPFLLSKAQCGSWEPQHNTGKSRFGSLIEVPITTLSVAGKGLPIAGGGYFRLFPYAVTKWGLERINHGERKPFVFYLHPWELDPLQPRMSGAAPKSRFRHYLNLHRTEKRFECLLTDFRFAPIEVCLDNWMPGWNRGRRPAENAAPC